ncbi:Predicted arabinose efflux permease, MFS family [Chryseobacterium taeanense]|uniref:Predicted arabinose efflux permease, MFS family n=1 Tax=Chryseobacterium taeanense TaxID=311334 RepID=A0A1G8FYH2_9FLAO|nr:MFS transporter [Chryseobacterium taeanense]SDH87214.1 Predicted arabinose efflux permease, MFS family [Chryseobacterium taeanense]
MKNTKPFAGADKNIIRKEKSSTNILYPLIFSVFAVYLTMGISLGVLPGFIKNNLQFGNLAIGITIGLQSLAALLTRAYAGKITDTLGAKVSNHRGIFLIFIAGLVYIFAAFSDGFPILALSLLIISRIIHGIGESMLVTGALTWGIGLLGAKNSGKVMTWNGIAMYAGIALGVPLSILLQGESGIKFPFILIVLLSIVSWLLTAKLAVLPVDATHVRIPFYKVIGKVMNQGLALAFSSMGFACIASFIALLFADKNWSGASLGFLCFGGFYIATRLFFASYPDKFGGYKVALVSFIVEIIGQLCIGFSTSGWMAIVGCALTGIGFSLVFPALGVLAIKKVQPHMRGTALGAYSAFFDLSLGVAGPVAGLIAGWLNYQSIYIFGAISGLTAILILFKEKNSRT